MQGENTATSYSIGDPIRVCDTEGEYIGIVIARVDAGTLEVQMVEKQRDGMYHVTEKAFHVLHESVVEHKPLYGSDDNAPRAFHEFGFRMIDGSTFVKHSDEVGDQLFPVGDGCFEAASDSDDSEGSLRDFIVPDEDCDPFTHATDSSDFVHETHAAVRGFNAWVPQTEQESSARQFILAQEARAVHINDEALFARNMPGAESYANPV